MGADPLLDTLAGSYRLLEHIGTGATSVVYKARRDGSDENFAVRIARSTGGAETVIHSIAHDAVPRVVERGQLADGRAFVAMELAPGLSLDQVGEMSITTACRTVAEVLDALATAHAAGIVHRRLTPKKILRSRDRLATVLGLSLASEGGSTATATYLAPEQIRGVDVGPAVDIYAAGAVLYELVCRRPPFSGERIDVERKHLEERPTPPRVLRPEIPSGVHDILLAALAKDPRRRPETAAAMRDQLRDAISETPRDARTPSDRPSLRRARPSNELADSLMHDPRVGRALGGFTLRERIGEGGFGVVYRASQAGLEREAVVKLLHQRLHTSRSATERFLREAKLASTLDHPYAAHIYAFGAEPDGELWIAMELVRGMPLDRLLKLQGPIPLERFAPLLDRICEVVHSAHEQGIVHRDIKPPNVMVLSRAGRMLPKLLDLGIAKGEAAEPESSPPESDASASPSGELSPPVITRRGAIVGSPPYMAPEQWHDPRNAAARTDLYALGVLAYEAITGKTPFSGATASEIQTAHETYAPPLLGPRFPAGLDAVFTKVLAKNPDERYPDALAFATAFRAATGIGTEAVALPALDPARRDLALTNAPQPIAEAVAAVDGARSAHRARDALVQLARTIARVLGLFALACRSRVPSDDESFEIAEALRALYRGPLPDAAWLDLAVGLASTWADRRDAYPIPELVDALHDSEVPVELRALLALRERETDNDAALIELLEDSFASASRVLDALAFLGDYPLVVPITESVAERWMGMRRAQRTSIAVRSPLLVGGEPALVDRDGAPVLALAPLLRVAVPTPGAPAELFLFDGRDARGGKYVALPAGFEHHDDDVWDWLRAQLAGTLDDTTAAVTDAKPPYRGLTAFSTDDGASFFGREKLVDAVVNRLKVQPLLAVVGRSGAGKSSFVHAGVVPALAWRTIALRPGPSPLTALGARLEHAGFADATAIARGQGTLGARLRADAAEHGPLLLVVDQLEEMFTLCQDAAERRTFAEALASAARSADDPVRVIVTLRDDFLVRTEQVPALGNRIGQSLQLVGVPAADDLERIVVEPARRAGYQLEGDLAAEMVREVADQPGALPLISFTAFKLWELRDRHFKQLTRAAYKTLGGVGGALARHADVTLDDMRVEERALAREAFRHLVTSQGTRAVISRGDLRQLLGGDEHADRVTEKLVAARLLVASENESGDETIEIVHEALLVTWPRLVEWRHEDAEGARLREQLRAAAAQWHDRGRPKGLLWRGDALADYTRWRARHPGPLTDVEAAFADASLGDAASARRTRRLLLALAFAVLGAGTVVFAVLSAQKKAQADELHAYLVRQYEDQGRRFVLAGDPMRGLAYLQKSGEMGARGASHDFLIAEAVRATDGKLVEVRHSNGVRSPHFSHDGEKIVTAGYDNEARIWDSRTGQLLATLPHTKPVRRAAFSPDDTTVLTGAQDGTVTVWDAHTGARRYERHHDGYVGCTSYTPDGKLILTGGDDDSLEFADAATGTPTMTLRGGGTGFHMCTFSRDGTRLAAIDGAGTTRIWELPSGKLLRELGGRAPEAGDLDFSPDGTRLVVAASPTAIEYDVATGTAMKSLEHQSLVRTARFSNDGRSIVTASDGRLATVWNADTGERRFVLAGHASAVTAARFSPDDRYVVTVSGDAKVLLWDARTGRAVAHWRGHRDAIVSAPDFDRDGARVVTAGDDGSAIVWRLQPQERVTTLLLGPPTVNDARYSPDGTRVVTVTKGMVALWDAATGAPLHKLAFDAQQLSYRPDGTGIALAGVDGTIRLWDGTSERDPSIIGHLSTAAEVLVWSPDSSLVVAGSPDGMLRGYAANGELKFERNVGARIYGIAFFPRGDRFRTIGEDSMTRMWDATGRPVVSERDADLPVSLEIDHTGEHLLSAVTGQRAKISDARSGATEAWLEGHVGTVMDATWSRDGQFAITSSVDGTARIWDDHGALVATLPEVGQVWHGQFSPDGTSVVLSGDGGASIHELPHVTAAKTDAAMRCLPFEWVNDHPEPKAATAQTCR